MNILLLCYFFWQPFKNSRVVVYTNIHMRLMCWVKYFFFIHFFFTKYLLVGVIIITVHRYHSLSLSLCLSSSPLFSCVTLTFDWHMNHGEKGTQRSTYADTHVHISISYSLKGNTKEIMCVFFFIIFNYENYAKMLRKNSRK